MEWIHIMKVLGITEESCTQEREIRESYEKYHSLTNIFQRFMFLWKNRRNHNLNDQLPLEIYDFFRWWDSLDIIFEIKYLFQR